MSDSGRVLGDRKGSIGPPKCREPQNHKEGCVCALNVCWYCGVSRTDNVSSSTCPAANGGEHYWVSSDVAATSPHTPHDPDYKSVEEPPPNLKVPSRLGIGAPIGTPPKSTHSRPPELIQEPPPPGYYWVGDPSDKKSHPFDTTACEAVACLLRLVGVNPSSPEVRDTPKRVVKAWLEMTAGYKMDPAQILGTVFEESYDEIIILRQIPFSSVCEHHCLPFTGTVDVGYVPGKVVGLSKLARLVDCFALRLQMQERMTRQIAEALEDHLGAKGVAVVSRGVHSCMCNRGVRKSGAEMVCSTMLGLFRDNAPARAEFLSLCKG